MATQPAGHPVNCTALILQLRPGWRSSSANTGLKSHDLVKAARYPVPMDLPRFPSARRDARGGTARTVPYGSATPYVESGVADFAMHARESRVRRWYVHAMATCGYRVVASDGEPPAAMYFSQTSEVSNAPWQVMLSLSSRHSGLTEVSVSGQAYVFPERPKWSLIEDESIARVRIAYPPAFSSDTYMITTDSPQLIGDLTPFIDQPRLVDGYGPLLCLSAERLRVKFVMRRGDPVLVREFPGCSRFFVGSLPFADDGLWAAIGMAVYQFCGSHHCALRPEAADAITQRSLPTTSSHGTVINSSIRDH